MTIGAHIRCRVVPGPRAKRYDGLEIGDLSVSGPWGRDRHGRILWEAVCKCGEPVVILGERLGRGQLHGYHLACPSCAQKNWWQRAQIPDGSRVRSMQNLRRGRGREKLSAEVLRLSEEAALARTHYFSGSGTLEQRAEMLRARKALRRQLEAERDGRAA